MSAKNMRVLVGVTPRASPMPSPTATPREQTFTQTECFSQLNSVAPSRLSIEDQKVVQAVLEERDRNFMAARQLLMDHALAAKEAETLSKTNGDKLTAHEAELIAKRHDEMVENIMHELNTMEMGYEKIIQNLQAKEMMSQLKVSLEAKCRELRKNLAQQEEHPMLRDLEQVLAKQEDSAAPAEKRGAAGPSWSKLNIPPSICGSSATHTPRSEDQTPASVNQTPRSENSVHKSKNKYIITPNELSDPGSIPGSSGSSLASTPRTSNAQSEYQTLQDLKAARIDEDKEALRMMKQLKASLAKKRSNLQQDLSAKDFPPQKKNDLSRGLLFQPDMRSENTELGELCLDLDPSPELDPSPDENSQHICTNPEVIKNPAKKASVGAVVKSYYEAAERQKQMKLQLDKQGLRDIEFELEELTQDLDSLQAPPEEETLLDAPVMRKDISLH